MSECKRVLQVWFDSNLATERKWRDLSAPRFLSDGENPPFNAGPDPVESVFGVRLWKAPDGGHVFRWAVEPVTCTDERWTLFGPFETGDEAMREFEILRRNIEARGGGVEGWRLFNEHCVIAVFRGNISSTASGKPEGRPRPWPRNMWTDG
jgi:hypothetical protein